MKAIQSRRSIRKYLDKAVSENDIKDILKAGMCAPSAHNQQPYRFVVIKSKEMRQAVAEVHPYAKMLPNAAFGVLVYYKEAGLKAPDFIQQDLSASIENMLIKANDLGIGSCWIGVYPKEHLVSSVREILTLDADVIPFSLISFGYEDGNKDAYDRYVEEWVTFK